LIVKELNFMRVSGNIVKKMKKASTIQIGSSTRSSLVDKMTRIKILSQISQTSKS